MTTSPVQEPPPAATAAEALTGMLLDGAWTVGELLPKAPSGTGGAFSFSYRVRHTNGDEAFLKALDYSRALATTNPAAALNALTTAYLHELGIVRWCTAKGKDRIARCLGDGAVTVPGYPVATVNYIIFEEADRDVRRHLDLMTKFDLAWRLRALHDVAVGLQQLHTDDAAHRDVKPSNVAVFDERAAKLIDLGRAVRHTLPDPYGGDAAAGDPVHAPVEALYGSPMTNQRLRALSCDLYHLGAMILFFFAGVSTTAALEALLAPEHTWRNWGDDYNAVLPYVRNAFTKVCDDLEVQANAVAPSATARDLVRLFKELCDPDPDRRGNPKIAVAGPVRFNVQRYVSVLDRLAKSAERGIGA